MKVVYVAGPYSAELQYEREDNIQAAKRAGLLVALAGGCPIIPHANTGSFWGTKTPDFWYEATSELLSRSDCALFVDHWWNSKGSVREMVQCLMEGIPCMVLPPRSDESGFVAEDTVVELLQCDRKLRVCRRDAIDTTLKAVCACEGDSALAEVWLRDWS